MEGPTLADAGGMIGARHPSPGTSDWLAALAAACAPRDPYRRLNPLTRIVISLGGLAAAILAPGPVGPALALIAFLALSLVAGRLGRLWRAALTAGVVVGLGTGILFVPRGDGLSQAVFGALDVGLRTGLAVLSLGLAALTAEPASLGLDLERRGLGRRLAFGLAALVAAWPALGARVATVAAAQEARGLRIAGGPGGRLRAVAPLWLPALTSTLGRVVDRSLALEARAFGHPGRRDLLWSPADPGWERLLRWLIAAAVIVAVAFRLGRALGLA